MAVECPSCKRKSSSDAAYCARCGARLAAVCHSCGRYSPPGAAFCEGCGQSLAGGDRASAAASESAPVPTSFASGRYQVERLLGEGAKKRVYLARDTRLNRDIALAVIKTDGLDAEGRTRVRREAGAMGQLGDHPHVVTVHDIVEEGEQLYIVSQFMSGRDLDVRLGAAENRRLPVDEALRLGDEIAQALEHAHAHGVGFVPQRRARREGAAYARKGLPRRLYKPPAFRSLLAVRRGAQNRPVSSSSLREPLIALGIRASSSPPVCRSPCRGSRSPTRGGR